MGNVVILSPEDDAQETLKPRLLAAEASVDRIRFVSQSEAHLSLSTILKAVEASSNVKLLIIDPITAYLGGRDMNCASAMREFMTGLASWSAKCGIAVVVVTHPNKTGSARSPLSRIMGSQAIGAVVRAVFMLCPDPADPRVACSCR